VLVNVDRINWPGVGTVEITRGPNGISTVHRLDFFGLKIDQENLTGAFYVCLIAFVFVIAVLWFVSESRTGRAWKALREDPLAAELLRLPVNWLTLITLAFGEC